VKKIKKAYIDILTLIGGALLAAIVVILCIQIVARRVSITVSWTEELARYTFVVLCFTVWPAVILKGSDVVISFLFDKMPLKTRRAVLSVMHVIMALVLVVVLRSAIRNIKVVGNVATVSMSWLKLSAIFGIVAFDVASAIAVNLIRGYEIAAGKIRILTDEERSLHEMEDTKAQIAQEVDPDAPESDMKKTKGDEGK